MVNLYKIQYASPEINNSIIENEYLNDSLFQHIYKKHYINNKNELDLWVYSAMAVLHRSPGKGLGFKPTWLQNKCHIR